MHLKLARKLLKELIALGIHDARLEIRSGHPRLVGSVNGQERFYVVPATESDWRSEPNARAGMKRLFEIARKPRLPGSSDAPSPARRPSRRGKPKQKATPTAPIAEAPADRFHAPLAALRASFARRAGHEANGTPPISPEQEPVQVLKAPFLGRRGRFTYQR